MKKAMVTAAAAASLASASQDLPGFSMDVNLPETSGWVVGRNGQIHRRQLMKIVCDPGVNICFKVAKSYPDETNRQISYAVPRDTLMKQLISYKDSLGRNHFVYCSGEVCKDSYKPTRSWNNSLITSTLSRKEFERQYVEKFGVSPYNLPPSPSPLATLTPTPTPTPTPSPTPLFTADPTVIPTPTQMARIQKADSSAPNPEDDSEGWKMYVNFCAENPYSCAGFSILFALGIISAGVAKKRSNAYWKALNHNTRRKRMEKNAKRARNLEVRQRGQGRKTKRVKAHTKQ